MLIFVFTAGNDGPEHFFDLFQLAALLLLSGDQILQILAVTGGLAGLTQALLAVGRLQCLLQLTLLFKQLLAALGGVLRQLADGGVLLRLHLALLLAQAFQRALTAGSGLCGRIGLSGFRHLLRGPVELALTVLPAGLLPALLSCLLLSVLLAWRRLPSGRTGLL